MAGKSTSANPLLISGKADTSQNVQLHPLVLLTISDYITRHTMRSQKGPVIGAVIGEQNGRNFTLEHAYQCKLAEEQTDDVMLDGAWFNERLEMYKEVHKVPALDLVALFTLGPVEGPQEAHLPILRQVRELTGSDSTMLLLFHPELVDTLQGGKLPISLYESVEDQEGDQVQVKFRELAFEVETGEAERIGVNFVATGSGNAMAVRKAESATQSDAAGSSSSGKDKKAKGKGKAKESEEGETNGTAPVNILSPEDDELISTLNSKVNAIKMLNERLNLIRSYLETLPQSYLTDASSTVAPPENTNFQLLRSVQSMLSRLPLLAPPDSAPEAIDQETVSNLELAAEKERQDVHLTSLLASLTRSVAEVQSLGTKFSVLQREKQNKERNQFRGPGLRGGFAEDLLTDNGGL